MNALRIAVVSSLACVSCAVCPSLAVAQNDQLLKATSAIVANGDFEKALSHIRETTTAAANTSRSFEEYVKAIGDGMEIALKQKDLSVQDVMTIAIIADHIENWARPLRGGDAINLDFVKRIAAASKLAHPASFAGRLGCHMQVVLFALAIERQDVGAAEAARNAAMALSKYEGEEGFFAQSYIPCLDVSYILISKGAAAARKHYDTLHKKYSATGFTDIEIIVWPSLKTLKERNVALGELEGVCDALDGRFNKGVKIRSVAPDSAAAKAGWHKGDRIIAIDGKTIFYNPDNMGRTQLEAVLYHRRNAPSRKPTVFTLKRGADIITTTISDNSIGIEF